MRVEERFLKYVRINTRSEGNKETVPSTPCQWDLAKILYQELLELGVTDAKLSEHCYVTGTLPSNLPEGKRAPALGLIAHMDTATETSGENVKPRIVKNYDGKAIVLNEELGIVLDPEVFSALKGNVGQDLIVTDGTTLLGADDKAGVAEIMTLVEYLRAHPEVPHGKICIGFTPDEEVGSGPAFFDVEGFGAELAYTVDGGGVNGLNYETFNAASAQIEIKGNVVHPGYAKGKMRNAALVATQFQAMIPADEHPACTDGYEGYFHLTDIQGTVSHAKLAYLLRDFELDGLERRKEVIRGIAAKINEEYGTELVTVSIKDSYRNMKEKILPHMEMIEFAAQAMTECGMKPINYPIRGGTDGAQLSFMGLPCPNLCMGGYNGHGPYEYCTVQNLELIVNMLIKLVGKFIKDQA